MELYKAEVCIGGLLTNTIIKNDITAAEILILRNIHGDDAVRSIKTLGEVNREYNKEYERLLFTYGRKKVQAAFPGNRPVLPQKLADVGIFVKKDGHITSETLAAGPNNPNFKTAKQKALEALGGDEDDDKEGDEE